jgi:hypothetical protein
MASAKSYIWLFKLIFLVGEVSPYVSTPRFARVCHYPLRGDTPRRPVQFLAKQDFALVLPTFVHQTDLSHFKLRATRKVDKFVAPQYFGRACSLVQELRLYAYFLHKRRLAAK